jgi:uncharacterized protein
MNDLQLIDAVKTGQLSKVEDVLNAGADIHQQDEQGWTPLNWAAGKGNADIVSLLLNRGADVFRTGRDQRTPYKIALAAKHTEAARLLKKAEQAVNGASADSTYGNYARAYLLGDLRKFSDWQEDSNELSDDDVVFLQEDFTVTQLIWPGENVIFNQNTPAWIKFCTQELQFKVPDDFDLIASNPAAKSAETA